MIGCNKLELNEATVMAALQLYFDQVVFAGGQSPRVTSFRSRRYQVGDPGEAFIVETCRLETDAPPVST